MTDQEICGACNGSRRMPRDPDIGTDQECFVCDGSGVIAAHEAKAAPAVPDADELESALERLVERCNTDQFLSNDDAVIHAEATLKRIYKSRKSTATPAAPSQPVTLTELLRQGFAVLMAKAYSEEWFDGLSSIDGLYEFLVAEGERIPDDTTIGGTIEAIIAALREKERA